MMPTASKTLRTTCDLPKTGKRIKNRSKAVNSTWSVSHFLILSISQFQNGPCPMQLVVVIAVKAAVSAATAIFNSTSQMFLFFILVCFSMLIVDVVLTKTTKTLFPVRDFVSAVASACFSLGASTQIKDSCHTIHHYVIYDLEKAKTPLATLTKKQRLRTCLTWFLSPPGRCFCHDDG